MSVTIYHNPACGTSRNTLAMIRQSGEDPEVIEYLKNPPSRERLIALIGAMGISVRALLRKKGTPYAELGLADAKWSDDQLLDFMLAHPILINRPIRRDRERHAALPAVGSRARVARPSRRCLCERRRRDRQARKITDGRASNVDPAAPKLSAGRL